ncbi:calmodulin-like [Bicyclus anynana]|uniref:Calmodulin-like n=1 Tax=Bicyclus anynana TaxID=110368 RepID=A0A6J1NUZ2_BICAN|nr:calmodulin-like [Bicyclus anynana]
MAQFDVFDPLANVTLRFTEEELSDIIEWFDNKSEPLLIINEGEPINVITIENLRQFLELKKFHKRCFHYPSYAEIMSQVEILKAGINRVLTKDQFIYLLDKWVIEPDLKHELKLAFKVFDTEKRDFLEIDEIKVIVTTYADVFNDAETREMLRDANVRGDGNVFYEDFVDSLFNVAPELYQLKAEFLYEDPKEDPSVPPDPIIEPEPEPEPAPSPPPPPPPEPKKKKKK